MNYYLGHLPWVDDPDQPAWEPPAGVVGMVDLRSIPDQSVPGSAEAPAFLATPGTLGSDWDQLGEGDCREISVSTAMQDLWWSVAGYRPDGAMLVDLLWDHLTTGSDPTGDSGVRPLVPNAAGVLELYLPGHSLLKSEPFRWGPHAHTPKLRDAILAGCEALFVRVDDGELPIEQVQRIVGGWLRKYRLPDAQWRAFVPSHRQLDFPGPRPPATTFTETWNGADGEGPGVDLTMTELVGDLDVLSNQGDPVNTCSVRAEHDLSSDDHYGQVVVSGAAGGYMGACCRFSASAETFYWATFRVSSRRTYKMVAGSLTILGNDATAPSVPATVKIETNGSTIRGLDDDVEFASDTDTAITGNTRGGVKSTSPFTDARFDDLTYADLAAAVGNPWYYYDQQA